MSADEILFHGLDMDELPFDCLDAPEWMPAGSCKAVNRKWPNKYTITVCNPRD